MSKAKFIGSVFLRSNIPKLELMMFSQFCYKVTTPEDGELLYFRCTEIDVSHHIYIEMKTLSPKSEGEFPMKVPHQYVLMIDGSGSENPNSIGFL